MRIERLRSVHHSRQSEGRAYLWWTARSLEERTFTTERSGPGTTATQTIRPVGIVRLIGGGAIKSTDATYYTDAHLCLSLSSSSLPCRNHQSLCLVILSFSLVLSRHRGNVSYARYRPHLRNRPRTVPQGIVNLTINPLIPPPQVGYACLLRATNGSLFPSVFT